MESRSTKLSDHHAEALVPVLPFESDGYRLRRHLLSLHERVMKEYIRRSPGRRRRLDLTAGKLRRVIGPAREVAYQQLCKRTFQKRPPDIETIAADGVDPTEGEDKNRTDRNKKRSPSAVCGGIRKNARGRAEDTFLDTGGLSKTRFTGELPVSVRDALERVLAKCIRGPDDWA